MLHSGYLYEDGALGFGSEYVHPELANATPKYIRIRDCLDNRIKEKCEEYLPDPSEVNESAAVKKKRYAIYHHNAQFLPVTRRTQQGLVAQVFLRQPTVKNNNIPDEVLDRISVMGGDVRSLAHYAMREVVGMGRGAFVVGITDDGAPMIDFIETEHILNWSQLPYGKLDDLGRNWQGCVVRTFLEIIDTDGIKVKKIARLSQYRIDVSGFAWVRHAQSDSAWSSPSWGSYSPVIFRGTHLRHIPVHPVGSEINTFDIMTTPLEEMVELNISHYNNSADYEEHVKVVGQVTVVFSGLQDDWYTKHIRGQVMFGVRKPIPLNEGAKAALLQAQPNSTAKEAMDKKEKMMIAIGARLIEERQVRKTATEAGIEDQSYHSILGHIAYNCSLALTSALRDVSYLFGKYDTGVSIVLTQDFGGATVDAEHRRLALEEWLKGVITLDEYRAILRGYSQHIQDDTVDEFKQKIQAELKFRRELAEIGAKPEAGNNPTRVSGADNRTQ